MRAAQRRALIAVAAAAAVGLVLGLGVVLRSGGEGDGRLGARAGLRDAPVAARSDADARLEIRGARARAAPPAPGGAGAAEEAAARGGSGPVDPGDGLPEAEPGRGLTGARALALVRAVGPQARTIDLAPPEPAEGAVSLAVAGHDPDGPRELVLWRRTEGRLRRIADGRSTATGALEFPQVLVPEEPFEIVVTASERGPDGLDHSDPVRVEASGPRPPHVRVGRPDAIGLPVRLTTGEGSGAVVLADETGLEIGRFPVTELPHPARQVFDAHLALPSGPAVLLVAHERPDGERSPWRTVLLRPPPAEADR